MELKTITNEENEIIISVNGELVDADAEEISKALNGALLKSKSVIFDLDGMEDMSQEVLLSILEISQQIPEDVSFDIINGGDEMDRILRMTGFSRPGDEDDGFYILEKSAIPEEVKSELPPYCVELLTNMETEVDAAVDENGESNGYIIYIADHYKKTAVINWIWSKDLLAEYFILETMRENLSREGIDSIRVNFKDAVKEENYPYIKEGTFWKRFVDMERDRWQRR